MGARSTHAQVNLTFSGGLGTPLVLTLSAPVVYTIIVAEQQSGPVFIFRGADPTHDFDGLHGPTTLTFSVDGGAGLPVQTINSRANISYYLSNNDLYLYGPNANLAVGDTVTLNPGTYTTNGNFAFAPPVSGSFITYATDQQTDVLSHPGFTVPEPGTWAMLLGVGVGALGLTLRRRSRAQLTS